MNDVPEGAYPFTTIDPSVGEAYARVDCAAPEFDESCTPNHGYCDDGTRFVPVRLVDVAGLVPGAHEGKGLGNQFLTDLNEADVLVHVVGFSGETDLEGEPADDHDPREDVDCLENELDQWDRDGLAKGIQRYASGYHGGEGDVEADLADQMEAFGTSPEEITQVVLSLGIGRDPDAWTDDDKLVLARESRQRTKPMVNATDKMDTAAAQANDDDITSDPDYDHLTVLPVSAHAEKALKTAAEDDVVDDTPGESDFDVLGDVSGEQAAGLERIREYVADYDGTGVQAAIETALFDVLDATAVFPGGANGLGNERGEVLPDCFILPAGSTAEDVAYHLHSDIGDGFLHALDCRSNRQVAGDSVLGHRDVVEIVTTNEGFRTPAAVPRRMGDAVDAETERLLTADPPRPAALATTVDDRPHVAPVWYVYDDGVVELVTTGRKLANVRENPRVALSVHAHEDGLPSWTVTLRGTATVVDDADATAAANTRINRRYGVAEDAWAGENTLVRVTVGSASHRTY
jgi:ribosome-binding ATPase YchF (GTP1/OBG family)/nitroimidazol reductase NimA-like FMN-containing flavoprotein (pyridoxamine 5'-phosphate oxidase superfamily)